MVYIVPLESQDKEEIGDGQTVSLFWVLSVLEANCPVAAKLIDEVCSWVDSLRPNAPIRGACPARGNSFNSFAGGGYGVGS